MRSIDFKIVTPEKVVYQEKIDKLTLPTEMGEVTILPGHVPLIANLSPGEMLIFRNGEVNSYAVMGGFVEVRTGDQVVILADAAERVEEIDVARAQEAVLRAKKLMEGIRRDDVKFAEAAGALERSLARLRVARKRRHGRGTIRLEDR